MSAPGDLIEELRRERAAFFATLERVDRSSLTTPGLIGEWSARDLVAHLGYWAGHAVELIHAVEDGRSDEVGADRPPADEINATVVRVARETDFATVHRREAASVEALVERLRSVDPALLGMRLPHHGLTLEQGVREDGADHYREHADELDRSLRGPST